MSLMDFFNASKIKKENIRLEATNAQLIQKMQELGITEYEQAMAKIAEAEKQSSEKIQKMNELGIVEFEQAKARIAEAAKQSHAKVEELNRQITDSNEIISSLRLEIETLQEKDSQLAKSIAAQERKLSRCKELYKSTQNAINNYLNLNVDYANCILNTRDFDELELISPSITLKLHCMDMKSLRKAYNENEKQITKLLKQYSSRYTTKANKSIYALMVIALRAEIQNVLYHLKYEKLDKSIEDVKTVSAKYLKIAGEGNQQIAGTLTKFIGEIEYLFINSVKIEYNYYVKKEQARQEQLAIRAQMKQEAEERKALEAERKKIEQEESKFQAQIAALTNQAHSAEGQELEILKSRILELQNQLSNVIIKKDDITNLQNGKAGNVYVISNLGSFGENVFKIGMTRRLDPQDRIDELGNASVPFRFDVHSFIFSDDASALETELHKRLNDKRVNKVNLRKEFFSVSIDELENLVTEICPTAEFNKTMLAEEFYQSQSTEEIYSSEYTFDDVDDVE